MCDVMDRILTRRRTIHSQSRTKLFFKDLNVNAHAAEFLVRFCVFSFILLHPRAFHLLSPHQSCAVSCRCLFPRIFRALSVCLCADAWHASPCRPLSQRAFDTNACEHNDATVSCADRDSNSQASHRYSGTTVSPELGPTADMML